ncbi:MAG: efflux transporter outer membrane subunit [Rhodoferax sp.]|nr:efflux transporter outer membrane subunit [Rhodoferax sp.]
MPYARFLFACCAALCLTACAVSPPPGTVPDTVPPGWYAPLPHNGNLTDLSQWWQNLGDPLLVQLVEAAQNASPSLASARSRIEQSRAARVQADAALLPALDATGSAARGLTQPLIPVATSLGANLQASWEIDIFGANRLASEAALARLDSARGQWHDARVAVAAEIANLYYNQRACEKQSAIAQSDAASRVQTSRLTALSTQAGFTAPATAALARASAAEANNRATQRRAACELDLKAMVALTGLAEPELRQKLATAPDDMAPRAAIVISSVPAEVLGQRPDLLSAQRDVAAASADTGSAQAQRYPRLGLTGSVGRQSFRTSAGSDDFTSWSIGPLTLSLPLFDGGRRLASVQAAHARYDEAAFLYQARVRLAVREVEQVLVNLQSTAARSGDAALAYDGYRASLTATEARYNGGLASLVELEDARRSALASADALVVLQRERIQAWIALYRATGGGWTPTTQAVASAP